jgi:hypothetical protein
LIKRLLTVVKSYIESHPRVPTFELIVEIAEVFELMPEFAVVILELMDEILLSLEFTYETTSIFELVVGL